MRADKPVGAVAVGALTGALIVCCGLPVVASLGAGLSLARLGLDSWALVALGAVIAAAGIVGLRRYHSGHPPQARSGGGGRRCRSQ